MNKPGHVYSLPKKLKLGRFNSLRNMECASIAKKLSNQGYCFLHVGIISLMVLAAVDLNVRYQRIDEKYSWLHEQRMKLGDIHPGELKYRYRRDASVSTSQLLAAIQSRVNSFEFR